MSALNYINDFTGGSLKFRELNESKLEEFKEFLLSANSKRSIKTQISRNTAVSYFNKVKATLKQAYKDGLLEHDLNGRITSIKPEETRREYLTLEELNQLVKTPCNNPLLKRVALFSVLTGLRFSDIQKMKWSELELIQGEGYFLNYDQKKTGSIEVLPISDQAYELTEGHPDPKSENPEHKVFDGLKYSAYQNKHLFQWIGAAGISKKISFHNFRHTWATLQLSQGTNLYTVSKMLGHKDIKTTQIYAKIVDKSKRDAVNKIKLDL